jgi:outer membrane protein OmpA-like peptidoglycan-associated protein
VRLQPRLYRVVRAAGSVLAVGALAAACGPLPESVNPVDWWHALEGGRIAEQRPPPPNVDAPYPSLGSVPPIPVPTDPATRARIASGLATDRTNAQFTGETVPARPGAATPASGRPPPPPPIPPAEADTASASLPAASAPPGAGASPASPRAAAPRPATLAPGPATSGPPSDGRTVLAAAPDTGTTVAPGTTGTVATAVPAALPTLPATPPAAPQIGGVSVPAVTVPTPPPVAPPPPVARPTVGATGVLVPFAAGSTAISLEAQNALRSLATRRGAAAVMVTGYGEAPLDDPAAQAAALPLALSRARAIAAVLAASGVPATAVRVDAQADGRGGAARLLN